MRSRLLTILMATAALSAGIHTAVMAQEEGGGGAAARGPANPVLDNWVERNFSAPTPKRIVYTSARALGMLRSTGEQDLFVRLRYKGSATAYRPAKSGPWAAVPITNYYAEISYPEAGMRVDETTAAGRAVHVVAGNQAWDEVGVAADGPPAGTSQKPTPEAQKARQLQLDMTPYGAIKIAHLVIDKVKVTKAGAVYVLTFPYAGTTMKVTLDRNRRPAKIEVPYTHPVLGKTVAVAEYSGYKDYEPISPQSDEPFSFAYFPSHIVRKFGDKVAFDLKVDTCWCTNPYLRFAKQAPTKPYATGLVSAATPRTAEGHPDLSGMWRPVGGSGVSRAFVNSVEVHEGGADNKAQVREGNYNFEEVDSEYVRKYSPDMPWYKPEMWEEIHTLEENAYRRPADPQYGCKNQGLARLGAPLESFLRPNKFMTLYVPGMAIPWFREAAIDGRPLPKHDDYEGVRPTGTSVAHWDGDTLVVESVDFPPGGGVWYDERAMVGDAEAKVTERYRRDGDRMTYDVTIEDPMFVEPWVRPTTTLQINKTAMLQSSLTCIEYDGDQLPPSS